jgi:hypothetical protein
MRIYGSYSIQMTARRVAAKEAPLSDSNQTKTHDMGGEQQEDDQRLTNLDGEKQKRV